MTTMNIGVFSELVNQKADLDLRNVDVSKTDIVIEYQEPTEENNYTWYRLYASGWVEQGGIINSNTTSILLLVRMEDNSYSTIISYYKTNSSESPMAGHLSTNEQTTNSFTTKSSGYTRVWRVSGKADMTGHEVLPSKKEKDENDHRVVVFQKPTAENGYKWYRKYADGWIEQGGTNLSLDANGGLCHVVLPIEMADSNYTVIYQAGTTSKQWATNQVVNPQILNKTTTGFDCIDNLYKNTKANWFVSGMFATN